MKAKKGHQEHIMNIATDRCEPPITPVFQRVEISREADMYVLTIPKRRDIYHGVKTKDGLVYSIRVGSRIREMRPYELGEPKERSVKIKPYTLSEKGLLWLSEKLLVKVSTSLNLGLIKGMLILIAIGMLSIAGALLLIFGIEDGKLVALTANYPWWINALIFIWLFCGIYLSVSLPTSAFETKCPACKSFFAFEKVESEILEKRTISEALEEWKVRNLYRCKVCKHEDEETKYEEHNRE